MILPSLNDLVPSPRDALLLAPPFVAYAVASGWVAGFLRVRRGIPVAYTRKAFHILIFCAAAAAHATGGFPAVNLYALAVSACVLGAVARGDGFPLYEALAREKDAPHRTLFVLVPWGTTALGGIASNLLFPAHAYVGYLVCGLGDAAGEPVGQRWGRHRYRVPSLAGVPATRSIEGSLAVWTAGTLAATGGLLASGAPPARALAVAAACGAAGALAEAVSPHGTDNLTVQIAAAGTAALLA